MVYTSREPKPYIKTSCKECKSPLEFLPEAGIKNTKVQVECWDCHKTCGYDIDASGTKIKTTTASKWGRKRGTGNYIIIIGCIYIYNQVIV
jgi:hypothetical protein